MQPPQRFDATASWHRDPARALVRLAWPITLSGLSFAVMGVIDTLLVSGLGPSMLAGVGLGAVATTGIMGFGFGLLRGVKVLLAQAKGSGARDHMRALAGAGLLVGLVLGFVMLGVGQLAALVVPQLTATAEAGQAAREYVLVRSLGAPIIVAYVALREARYGVGDTRSPMVTAILGNVLHAGLDYVLLYELRMGASGAALANVIAFTLQTLPLLVIEWREGLAFGPRERALCGAVARAGAFTGLQWALEIGSLALLSSLLAGVSDLDMAAHQIAVQLTAFSFLPALAIAESATMLTAEAVGSGRMALVPRVARATLIVALVYACGCALVFVGLGGAIVGFFSHDAALIAVARAVLLAAAAHQILEAATMAGHGVLRGVGAQRTSALCAVGCAWAFTLPLAVVFTRVLSLGAAGGWLARVIEVAIASGLLWRHIAGLGWVPSARRALRVARRARQVNLHASA